MIQTSTCNTLICSSTTFKVKKSVGIHERMADQGRAASRGLRHRRRGEQPSGRRACGAGSSGSRAYLLASGPARPTACQRCRLRMPVERSFAYCLLPVARSLAPWRPSRPAPGHTRARPPSWSARSPRCPEEDPPLPYGAGQTRPTQSQLSPGAASAGLCEQRTIVHLCY